MRTQIGFKNTNNKVEVQPCLAAHDNDLSFEDVMRIKGFEHALTILRSYFDNYTYPLLKPEQRDEFFFKQLRNTKERFFTPLPKL